MRTFQDYWDEQIPRLEDEGYGPIEINKMFDEAKKAWEECQWEFSGELETQ